MLDVFAQLVASFNERIAAGDHAGAAELFVEEGLGEGLWSKFPPGSGKCASRTQQIRSMI